MIAFLKTWIMGLIGAALFCALATELTPKGGAKSVLKALCGIVMACALLLPLLRQDYSAYALNLAKYRESARSVTQSAQENANDLNRRVIEEKLEAYIMDKAQTLGANVTNAEVSLRWSTDGVWYPVAVTVTGEYSDALADRIEGELGIGKREQVWRQDEEP